MNLITGRFQLSVALWITQKVMLLLQFVYECVRVCVFIWSCSITHKVSEKFVPNFQDRLPVSQFEKRLDFERYCPGREPLGINF